MRKASLLFVIPLAVMLGQSHAAEAQEVSRAQALFDEGRRLMTEGRYADACPKLAASQKLDPGAGTLMNLASCYEKNGQAASAWATLREAASAARATNHPDWERAARTRADQLEPKLPRLSVLVPPDARVEGLGIDQDGRELDAAEWGAAIPIDAGVHTIHARAPGKVAWSIQVMVSGAGARTEVKVPRLANEPQGTGTGSTAPDATRREHMPDDPPRSDGSSQRTLGLVLASAGGVGLATGVVLGLMAKSTNDEALGHCNAARQCDSRGIELGDTASSQADASTIAFVVGATLVAAGGVLYLTASRPKQSSTNGSLRLSVGSPGPMGVNLGGTF